MKRFSIKNSLLSLFLKKRLKNINKFITKPVEIQKEILNYLIKNGNKTKFGKTHAFNKITDYYSFKNQIPVITYEELYPEIEKIKHGGEDILWPGKTKWFAKSSGTTNDKSKFIPITKDSLYNCHLKAGKDMLSLYENNFPKKNIYDGKGLMLGGSFSKSKNNKIIEGDLSAILIDRFPFWVNYHRVPDKKTALIKDWNEKLDKIAIQALNQNITNLTGVSSWMLVLLNRVLELSGKENILKVWPNLELFIHGGVNFNPYYMQFKDLIPSKKMNYLEGYNASEGFFGIQDKYKNKGLLLLLNHGVFYEFIPLEKFKKGNRDAINISKVELNKDYALVITTNGGLWRYLIGDVIQFTTLYPFRIKIIGRTTSYINTFGEELMVHNTDLAITKSCEKFNCSISNYTVSPIFLDKQSGKHQFLIEFKREPKNLYQFISEVDNQLKKLNSDYETKRENNLILKSPQLISLRNNEFHIWLKEKNKLGGQHKIPRLNENRQIAERIISIKRSFQQK